MHTLIEFRQSASKPVRHVKLGSHNAHVLEKRLTTIFNRGGIELAQPYVHKDDASIRFLSRKPQLESVSEWQKNDPRKAQLDRRFAEAKNNILQIQNNLDQEWLLKILDNSILFTDAAGQHLCLVWGLEFDSAEVYTPPIGTKPTPPPPPPTTAYQGPPNEHEVRQKEPEPEPQPEPPEDDPEDDPVGPIVQEAPPVVESHRKWWLWLLIALLLILLAMLLLCLDGCNSSAAPIAQWSPVTGRTDLNPLPGFTPDEPNRMEPIPEERITEDPNTGQQIALGRVNTYPKNKEVAFADYLLALQSALTDSSIRVTDYCSETRRVQLDIGNLEYSAFASELKTRMQEYDLLTWPERILEVNMPLQNHAPQNTGTTDETWHLEAIHAEQGWAMQQGDPAITLAIIDSGFDLAHPDLDQDTLASYHVPNRAFEVYANQAIIHGTHVAGLAIGERENSSGTTGVGHGCSWMPIQLSEQTENRGFPLTHIIDGVLYAMNHGADVINMSLGTGINPAYFENDEGDISFENYLTATQDEAEFWNEIYRIGEQNNTLFVLAAGNDALPLELDPMHRSPLPIYVAATSQNGRLAEEFSNFPTGSQLLETPVICIAAPGEDIVSCAVEGDVISMPGTSMASPQVAGAAAVLRSANPALDNHQMRTHFASLSTWVSSVEMSAWALLPDAPINLTGTKWTLQANKTNPEQVVLEFLPEGKLRCSQCNNDYQRGEWRLQGPEFHAHFQDANGKVTSSINGTWTDGAFQGELIMHMWDERGTFGLDPYDAERAILDMGKIPFLRLDELLRNIDHSEPPL